MRSSILTTWLGLTPSLARAASFQHDLLDRFTIQRTLGVQDGRQDDGRPNHPPRALNDMLDALSAMQDTYFDLLGGTWPTAIDWTAAVMGTHVSATLSSLVTGLLGAETLQDRETCTNLLGWENIVNKYFTQISTFYYGENAFGLRHQAYDDMLWVVLGWLENIKFAETYAAKLSEASAADGDAWYGLQFSPLAAHRARIFYELAERGWDDKLCAGGMTWNPALTPYKNSITNELFISASISMYLYYPGDNNSSPYFNGRTSDFSRRRDPVFLKNAIKAYRWLREAGLTNDAGLYQDGYHITGWHKYPNGTIDPGTRRCDELEEMVYTYNQGVILTASRDLWLATGTRGYLDDGHDLVANVVRASGWPNRSPYWRGLGRAGVLEEFCDHNGQCSQDGQTFKGIFFHHLTEFCRPVSPQEKDMVSSLATDAAFDKSVYEYHMARCNAYGKWIEHNAEAALTTKNEEGLFGTWWGIPTDLDDKSILNVSQNLPEGATDYKNPRLESIDGYGTADLNDRGRGRTVETQSGGLAVLRARWQWQSVFGKDVWSL